MMPTGSRMLVLAYLLETKEDGFKDMLEEEGRQRWDRRLPRASSLLLPSDSAWERLYQSLNDQALITVTGFDHHAFKELLSLTLGFVFIHHGQVIPISHSSRWVFALDTLAVLELLMQLVALDWCLVGIDIKELNSFYKAGLVLLELMLTLGCDSDEQVIWLYSDKMLMQELRCQVMTRWRFSVK